MMILMVSPSPAITLHNFVPGLIRDMLEIGNQKNDDLHKVATLPNDGGALSSFCIFLSIL